MGIIDDYYGGYENLAMNTDSDGNVDFEGAYGTACDFYGDIDSDAAVFGGNTRNSKLGANAIRSEARPAANQQAVPDAKRKRANTKKTANGSSAAPKAAAGNKENNTASRKVAVETAKVQANQNDKLPAQKQR